MNDLTSDELGAGLVPGEHEVHHPGEGGPHGDVLRRLAGLAAAATLPGQSALVLQKVPSEANPKVRNHGEGPY